MASTVLVLKASVTAPVKNIIITTDEYHWLFPLH